MEDPVSCDFQVVKLTQRIVLFTATILLCLETATKIIFDRRIKTSKLMQLHLVCALAWGMNAILYGISFNLTDIPYLGTNETSIIFDGIARRTMCVMVGIPDRARKAYLGAVVFVCLWATAADIAMFIGSLAPSFSANLANVLLILPALKGYLTSNGNFQPDIANLTYIVGVLLDLTFCVASDTMYIRAILKSQRFRGTTSYNHILLPLSNIISISLIQIISITLLFVGVDQEYGYHNLTTALRIRFFAFMVQFTETILSRETTQAGATSNKKGGASGSHEHPRAVGIAARTMSSVTSDKDKTATRQPGAVV
ncbi:hypothetical protein HK104_009751 [Borealophlyctis nickersoniae]|nr:hypothetical protein HK104_009751 [Borealophlyctis nickersoniae]